jgi:hypothetical protein
MDSKTKRFKNNNVTLIQAKFKCNLFFLKI